MLSSDEPTRLLGCDKKDVPTSGGHMHAPPLPNRTARMCAWRAAAGRVGWLLHFGQLLLGRAVQPQPDQEPAQGRARAQPARPRSAPPAHLPTCPPPSSRARFFESSVTRAALPVTHWRASAAVKKPNCEGVIGHTRPFPGTYNRYVLISTWRGLGGRETEGGGGSARSGPTRPVFLRS